MIKKTFTLKSSLSQMTPVVKEIQEYLKDARKDAVHDIKLAVEEAIINAMKHGNKFNEGLHVIVDFAYDAGKVCIAIQDEGKGYDYQAVPDPTIEENILRGHGRGVFLIRKLMDEVRFNNSGNRIEMIKYIKGG
jgi:serine/threonine-protein kinase RsbW